MRGRTRRSLHTRWRFLAAGLSWIGTAWTAANTTDWAGGVAFDALDPANLSADAEAWEKAIRKMRTGMMPPAGKPRPSRAVLDGLASELATRLDASGVERPQPGSKSLHRLNRTEYANAIRDLLAYDIDVSSLIPADDAAEGFDNIADVLSVSPTLIQSYVSAAMKISRAVVGDRSMAPILAKYSAPPGLSQQSHIEGLPLGTRGGIRFTHNFPLDAEYEFRVSAGSGFRFAGPGGGPAPLIDITLNGEPVKVPDPRKFRMRVKAGPQTVGIALVEQKRWAGVDDLYARSTARRDDFENVVINGPFNATGTGDTPSRRAIFVCQPQGAADEEACASRILTHLARKGFRRPIAGNDASVATLMEFYRAGRKQGSVRVRYSAGRCTPADRPAVPLSRRNRSRRMSRPVRSIASAMSSWPRGSPSSSGAVFPTTRSSILPRQTSCTQPKMLEQQVRRMLADSACAGARRQLRRSMAAPARAAQRRAG